MKTTNVETISKLLVSSITVTMHGLSNSLGTNFDILDFFWWGGWVRV